MQGDWPDFSVKQSTSQMINFLVLYYIEIVDKVPTLSWLMHNWTNKNDHNVQLTLHKVKLECVA